MSSSIQLLSSPIIIEDTTANGFRAKIEAILLSPPEWVAQHVQMVRTYLNGVKEIGQDGGYSYSPEYISHDFRMNFACSFKKYKVTIIHEDPLPDFIREKLKDSSAKSEAPVPIKRSNYNDYVEYEHRMMFDQPWRTVEQIPSDTVYHGRLTDDSLKYVPEKAKELTSKYAASSFPYQLTVEKQGNITVSGTVSSVGRKINMSEWIKANKETGISFEDWLKQDQK